MDRNTPVMNLQKSAGEMFEPQNVVAVSQILCLRHPVAVLVQWCCCQRRQAALDTGLGLGGIVPVRNPERLRERPLNRVAGHAEGQRGFGRQLRPALGLRQMPRAAAVRRTPGILPQRLMPQVGHNIRFQASTNQYPISIGTTGRA